MIWAPGLVQGGDRVADNDLVADEAHIAKQLVVVRLAVRQTLLFVVLVAEEGLLALGAHKVLHMPLLAQRSDHSLLDWSSAGATDGDAHFVVAAQAVQLALDLASAGRQLDAARLAVEVIRVVGLALKLER